MVYLVAIGDAVAHVAQLERYYRETAHLHVEVLAPFTPPLESWNPRLRHWRAESLLAALLEREEGRLRSGSGAVIGITPDDLSSVPDGWVFAWRSVPMHVGVISYARMDPWRDQRREDATLLHARLRHMTTRYVGTLALDLPDSTDPHSPLYSGMRSVRDLDAIDDDLLAAGFLMPRRLNEFRAPIELTLGAYSRRDYDLRREDTPSISFERTYRSNETTRRGNPFGIGTNHSYGTYLVGDPTFSWIDLVLDNATRIHYTRTTPGTTHDNAVLVHETSSSQYLHSRLSWRDGGWLIELADGQSYRHPACSPTATKPCTVSGYRDRLGRELRMTFNAEGGLARIETPDHKFVALEYDSQNRITAAHDDLERELHYAYDADGRLVAVTTADGATTTFTYDGANRMIRAQSAKFTEAIGYDENGRCRSYRTEAAYRDLQGHSWAWSRAYAFTYEAGQPSDPYVRAVRISDGRDIRHLTYDSGGYVVRDVFGPGTAAAQTTAYERDPHTAQITRIAVTCGPPGREHSVTDMVTIGQDPWPLVRRAQVACDRQLLEQTH